MNKAEIIFTKIQKMREDNFSKEILIPLLYKMGYKSADFYGGAHELGKDIVAHKFNEFEQLEVTVIQSKMFKTERTSQSSLLFGQIVHQLRLCKTKKIPCIDGMERLPTKVLFITPFKIDTRHLGEQFETAQIDEIILIDQSALNKLFEKYWPEIYDSMESTLSRTLMVEQEDITNLELYKALHIESKTSYTNYYSDLNFFVGETESRKVFSSKLVISKELDGPYEEEEWIELKKINGWLNQCTGIGIIPSTIDKIEEEYKAKLNSHNSFINKKTIRDLQATLLFIEANKESLTKTIDEVKSDISASLTTASERKSPDSVFKEIKNYHDTVHEIELLTRSTEINYQQIESLAKPFESLVTDNKKIKPQILSLGHIAKEIRLKTLHHKKLSPTIIPHPKYEVTLDCESAESSINSKIATLSIELKKLNNRELTNTEVRTILDETNSVLRCIDGVTRHCKSTTLNFSLKKDNSFLNELDISAHSIFDSGSNIAVYGEAGAGKSTTLYVYAEKTYKNKSSQEEVLFIPLNRLTSKLGKLEQDEKNKIIDRENNFHSLINAFLLYKDIAPSSENRQWLIETLNKKSKTIIIIDALDESAKDIDWIIPALSEIPNNIKNAQVITSSRNCVKFVDNIDFLGISLLPFSKEQLRKFIFGWLHNQEHKEELWRSIQDNELFEVAKNPLLATIICTLHENGIPIPENEPDVYRRKIELLCGLYDQSKGIRRTKNERTFLETCCQKIAYRMHANSQREATIKELDIYLSESLESRVKREVITSALDDLINVCNVLVKTPDVDAYSFGHLRIQESLAAEELAKNRSIDILSLISQDWWAGALFLYSFKNNIQPLIDETYSRYGSFARHKSILGLMINSQPKRLQRGLKELLEKHSRADLQFGFEEYNKDDLGYLDHYAAKDILGY